MTVDEILQTIHRIYEGSIDYPTTEDEEYIVRLGLINDCITEWGENENVKWSQLFASASGSISSATISCPDNFVSISSLLKIGDNYFFYKKADEVMLTLKNNPSAKIFWITGSPSNYVININPEQAIGSNYLYYYYKTPALVSSGSDIPEVPKPMFIVYWVLARLYEQDGELSKMSFYEQKAVDKLQEMIIENESPAFNYPFEIISDDINYKLYGVNLGQ